MAIKTFYHSRPERDLTDNERWQPATPESVGIWASDMDFAKEPGWVVAYEGLVVSEREDNGRDDSDFYARVFVPETGGFTHICWGSTRYWTYLNGCEVDAPEALKEFSEDMRREAWAEYWASVEAERVEKERTTPSKGKIVKVVRGRKVPKGTEHKVFWYGEGRHGARVGLEPVEGGERVFTAASNVEVIPGMVEV